MAVLVNKRGLPCNRCGVCADLTRDIRVLHCDDCLADFGLMSQVRRVYSENYRARKNNLEATLTNRDWLSTLAYFTVSKRGEPWIISCAYCGTEEPVDRIGIDHWIALAERRVGTTHINVIPACELCNFMKGSMSGNSLFRVMINRWQSEVAKRNYERIQRYFKEMFKLDSVPL
jgi:hypothetical protein